MEFSFQPMTTNEAESDDEGKEKEEKQWDADCKRNFDRSI